MARTSKSPATRAKRKSRPLAFPVEFRLRIVKLYLEEGYSRKLLVEQFGISTHSIQRWVRAYFGFTEPRGLSPSAPSAERAALPRRFGSRRWQSKREHPEYGPRRISDFLKRFFLMRTSPATVHKTLAARGLVKKAPVKPEKNPAKPRFLRAGPAEPALAVRHLDHSARGPQRLPDRLHRRLQPLHHRPGVVPQPDRRARA